MILPQLRRLLASTLLLGASAGTASAGGLLLPGNGAVSTSRAGASVASAAGAEAIPINPAGMSKMKGTVVSISSSFIDYDLAFKRAGSYDASADAAANGVDIPWAGERYPTVVEGSKPKIGFGNLQAVPVLAVSSDLGGKIPGLRIGFAVFGPGNAYPDRDLGSDYVLDSGERPMPTRYDMVRQQAAVSNPSIAASYAIGDKVDVGGRFSWGLANITAGLYLWGVPQNFSEWSGHDAYFELDAKDNFAPNFGFGVLARPIKNLELGAQFSSAININAVGTGHATVSQYATIGPIQTVITPNEDQFARCNTGGTAEALATCVDFQVPANATLGGRYVFRDGTGSERGDVELNVRWENWGEERASDYLVVIDAVANGTLDLKDALVKHSFKDTWSARLGGSYAFAVGPGALIARGGVAYDTKAAKEGWERVNMDGAARTTLAAGASYRTSRFQIDLGLGFVFEGTRENGDANCNPTTPNGCSGMGAFGADETPGVDPVFPLSTPQNQLESPVNAGTFSSSYKMMMLGMSTWF